MASKFKILKTVAFATATIGAVAAIQSCSRSKLPNPTEIAPVGQDSYNTAGEIDVTYTSLQPVDTKAITDATYTLTNKTGDASKLSITSDGHLTGTLVAHDSGSFKVHVASAKFNISGDMDCTIDVYPDPTGIEAVGQTSFHDINPNISIQYSFLGLPVPSQPITNVTYSLVNQLGAGNKLQISPSGLLTGSLEYEDEGTFNIRTTTTDYGGFYGDLPCLININNTLIVDSSLIVDSDLVHKGTPIYTKKDSAITSHNTLFNLSAYAERNGFLGKNFYINDIIEYGLLIGQDQDATIRGDSNIEAGSDDTDVYGVVVGSTQNPGTNVTYSGELTIEDGIFIKATANAGNSYGLYIKNSVSNDLKIYGHFDVSCQTGYSCYGMRIESIGSTGLLECTETCSIIADYKGTGTGTSGIGDAAFGFYLADVSGIVDLNGNYNVRCSKEEDSDGNACAEGVWIQITGDNNDDNVTIGGFFDIANYLYVNGHSTDAYGVNCVLAGSSAAIVGVFNIDATNICYPVSINDIKSDKELSISGLFVVGSKFASSRNTYGIYLTNTAYTTLGTININGHFDINTTGQGGVIKSDVISGCAVQDMELNGMFVIKATGEVNIIYDTNPTVTYALVRIFDAFVVESAVPMHVTHSAGMDVTDKNDYAPHIYSKTECNYYNGWGNSNTNTDGNLATSWLSGYILKILQLSNGEYVEPYNTFIESSLSSYLTNYGSSIPTTIASDIAHIIEIFG